MHTVGIDLALNTVTCSAAQRAPLRRLAKRHVCCHRAYTHIVLSMHTVGTDLALNTVMCSAALRAPCAASPRATYAITVHTLISCLACTQ